MAMKPNRMPKAASTMKIAKAKKATGNAKKAKGKAPPLTGPKPSFRDVGGKY